jgi:hypothetical protein
VDPDPDPAFQVNPDPDPGFDYKIFLKIMLKFFLFLQIANPDPDTVQGPH